MNFDTDIAAGISYCHVHIDRQARLAVASVRRFAEKERAKSDIAFRVAEISVARSIGQYRRHWNRRGK